MTKLEQIVKRAKQIRLAQPNKFAKWTDYVKFASKDLADKVVGKKKTVGKANLLPFPKEKKQTGKSNTEYDRRNQAMAPGKRKASPAAKKPYYYESRANRSDKGKLLGMHKDTKSHNVRINVMSGIDKTLKRYNDTIKEVHFIDDAIIRIRTALPFMTKPEKTRANEVIKSQRKILTELKTHARELKKHIK
jgi:hypothetical protein